MNLALCGTGRIDETQPIELADYTIGYSPYRNEPVPVMAVPQKIRFYRTIADTVYDVTGLFDEESDLTLLQQLKDGSPDTDGVSVAGRDLHRNSGECEHL